MKRILGAIFLIIGAISGSLTAYAYLPNPNFNLGEQNWTGGWSREIIKYTVNEQGSLKKDQYLALTGNGVNWTSLVTGTSNASPWDVLPVLLPAGTPLYFYIEAGLSKNCGEVEVMVRVSTDSKVRDRQIWTVKNSDYWHVLKSNEPIIVPENITRIALQIDYKVKNCSNGTFDVNYANVVTDLKSLENHRGYRSRK